MLTQTDLFIGGQQGYHTYRIPAMTVSTRGTVLAFCEGRRYSSSDTGDIDLILKRSFDDGRTWEPTQTVVTEPAMTCGNPCPVVDNTTGTIWLPFCKNLADGPESMIRDGKAPRTVWLTHSDDDGATWAEPIEITPAVKKPFLDLVRDGSDTRHPAGERPVVDSVRSRSWPTVQPARPNLLPRDLQRRSWS